MGNNRKHSYKIEKKETNSNIYFIDTIEIDRKELQNGVEITWHADDTEFEIWFPRDQNPFSNLPEQAHLNSENKTITKRIRNNLKPGTYSYFIFCQKTKTMAEGNSFPSMIIKG